MTAATPPEAATEAGAAAAASVDTTVDPCRPPNLGLRERRFDWFFIVMFSLFTITSLISDLLPSIGVDFSQPSSNFFVNSNWWYAHDTDPLFMEPPTWMRIVTGLSAFVYMPFYIVLVISLIRGWNWIQLPSVIYATMISTITGIIVFGVEFLGEPEWVTPNPVKFLAFNLPYVLVPILLLVRMRKPLPFARRF
ncbi:EXPERA domain-containing protein [Agromyces allii]|uniref:EXPERA domain-containing protein n=1 Tax=Agromyces allii TaxID=393607 RepID=A0ABN2QXU4_9MICO|nr:emopamil-binding family protein [Agromyces allii]